MYYYDATVGRETGRLQYPYILHMPPQKACVRGESHLFLKRGGCGRDSGGKCYYIRSMYCTYKGQEKEAEKMRDHNFYSSILAPSSEKKYELRRRLLLQIRIRDPASRHICYRSFWSEHNPSADLRATGGVGLGMYSTYAVHAFDPIVDTTLYTIVIYTNSIYSSFQNTRNPL